MKQLATNRRAGFDYDLGDRLTAGMVLVGHEVKSIKAGQASLKGSFITLKGGEAFLMGSHVTPYAHAEGKADIDPTRQRKLLLHRRQLDDLQAAKDNGSSLVPVALWLDKNRVKLELAIGTGKKRYDKRETIKRRDTDRDIGRDLAKFSRR
jgi:SsrA-binding protein